MMTFVGLLCLLFGPLLILAVIQYAPYYSLKSAKRKAKGSDVSSPANTDITLAEVEGLAESLAEEEARIDNELSRYETRMANVCGGLATVYIKDAFSLLKTPYHVGINKKGYILVERYDWGKSEFATSQPLEIKRGVLRVLPLLTQRVKEELEEALDTHDAEEPPMPKKPGARRKKRT